MDLPTDGQTQECGQSHPLMDRQRNGTSGRQADGPALTSKVHGHVDRIKRVLDILTVSQIDSRNLEAHL